MSKICQKKIKYGFGGVSRLEKGKLILSEHFRLGSSMVIINRDFRKYKDKYEEVIKEINMKDEIENINRYLKSLEYLSEYELENNRLQLKKDIQKQIKERIKNVDS